MDTKIMKCDKCCDSKVKGALYQNEVYKGLRVFNPCAKDSKKYRCTICDNEKGVAEDKK